MTNYRCIRTENWGVADNQVFHGLFVYIPAIWVFLAARLLFEKWPPSDTCSKMWTMLGKSTLGVMLIEGVIRSKLEFLFHFLNHMVGSMTACALWILACLAVGVGVTWIMGHIPVLRKFV